MNPYKIQMHHVGSRGGGFPFKFPARFKDGIETWIYDADPACHEMTTVGSPEVDHVVSACVTAKDGPAQFHVNYDPYTSSLRKPNPAMAGLYYNDHEGDYLLGDVLRPVKTLDIEGETLDSLSKTHGFTVDYLSLDVQGCEYDILESLSDNLLSNTVAVMAEISFFPFYEGQKMFDEIIALMRSKGFFVAEFIPHGQDWETHRTGIGWRGKGFTAHGDVLFYREPSKLTDRDLGKAAFIALCNGHVGHALLCLASAGMYWDEISGLTFHKFLSDIEACLPVNYIKPPSFAQLWTAEESLARFDLHSPVRSRNGNMIRQMWSVNYDLKTLPDQIDRLSDPEFSPFEELLIEYEFTGLAETVREKRLKQIEQVHKLYGTTSNRKGV